VACVARELREAERLLDEAQRYLSAQEYELASAAREIVSLDD
jgi:F0F1-type ATP synthase membrane subunit b/b'